MTSHDGPEVRGTDAANARHALATYARGTGSAEATNGSYSLSVTSKLKKVCNINGEGYREG